MKTRSSSFLSNAAGILQAHSRALIILGPWVTVMSRAHLMTSLDTQRRKETVLSDCDLEIICHCRITDILLFKQERNLQGLSPSSSVFRLYRKAESFSKFKCSRDWIKSWTVEGACRIDRFKLWRRKEWKQNDFSTIVKSNHSWNIAEETKSKSEGIYSNWYKHTFGSIYSLPYSDSQGNKCDFSKP